MLEINFKKVTHKHMGYFFSTMKKYLYFILFLVSALVFSCRNPSDRGHNNKNVQTIALQPQKGQTLTLSSIIDSINFIH
jgi:hypothetical protein